ncbi:MAG TPA: hypothetical protein PK127_01185 [Clostridiales bacterium]|nr:hypothetical protein [Clostridiales bacterium]HPV01083.1 hypothetical protein [Clostridiales bacterium]
MDSGKTRPGKKLGYISGLILLCLIAAAVVYAVLAGSASASLGGKRFSELREKYPLYEYDPPLISMNKPKFDDLVKRADAFILAEVVEVLPEYTIELIEGSETPEGKIYEKGKEYGMENAEPFVQYRVRVIENITGESSGKGEEVRGDIIIAMNAQFKGYAPEPEPGMRIVTPVSKGEGKHEGKYFYSKYGFYYVTDDDYVMSAYVEDHGYKFSGRTLDHLKKKIRELAGRK